MSAPVYADPNYQRAYKQRRRAEALARGFCGGCWSAQASPGLTKCFTCRMADAKRLQATRDRAKLTTCPCP